MRIIWMLASMFTWSIVATMGQEMSLAVYNGMYLAHHESEPKKLIVAFIYVDRQSGKIELPEDALSLHRISPGAYMDISAPPSSSILQRSLVVSDDMDSLVNSVMQWQKKDIHAYRSNTVLVLAIDSISELNRNVYVGWLGDALSRFQNLDTLRSAAGSQHHTMQFVRQMAEGFKLRLAPTESETPQAIGDSAATDKHIQQASFDVGDAEKAVSEIEAYRILGLAPGTDVKTVERTYQDLRDMYYPQQRYGAVHQRIWHDIEAAYNVLQAKLAATPVPPMHDKEVESSVSDDSSMTLPSSDGI